MSYQEEDCMSEVRIETCSIVKSREKYKFVFPKMSNVVISRMCSWIKWFPNSINLRLFFLGLMTNIRSEKTSMGTDQLAR